MTHRFQGFEIDEATRELRAAGRVLTLQPRVFDLLVCLAKNRDRVVPKEELLETVWPGVIVADGSLQRAISLARSALTEAGAPEAIRTYSRRGYRFCVDGSCPPETDNRGVVTGLTPLESARLAYAGSDWDGVIDAMGQVSDLDDATPQDLQAWVHAVQCSGRPKETVLPLENAVAAYRSRGDRRRAAWVAILLSQLRLEWRQIPVANGWLHRAERILQGEPASREKGYLYFAGCRLALMQNKLETALELAERARKAGERFNDPDLESIGLLYLGEASLFLGKIPEGLAALDEAGASVMGSGLSPWVGGLIFCGVIYSCITRADWYRAGQWTEQFTRWGKGKGPTAYPGLCRIHRAEILSFRGDLTQAEREIRATQEMLGRIAPWVEGEAFRVLGQILLAKGDLPGAREALARANELGWETQFELAQIRLAEGDAQAATRIFARGIAGDEWSCRSKRGQALAHCVIAAATAGALADARKALAELEATPDLVSTTSLKALAGWARAELVVAEGRVTEGLVLLRSTLREWLAIEAPLPAAQVRCRLATLLTAERDYESAELELSAAAAAYRQAGADELVRRCEKVLREIASSKAGVAQTAGSRARRNSKASIASP